MLLSVQSLEKQFNAQLLFSGISFTLDEGHKVALVGKNGVGKSTLLKIIAGCESTDGGSVTIAKGKTVAHLPQEIIAGESRTGIAYITAPQANGGSVPEHRAYTFLNSLGISKEIAALPLKLMSGGQQSKILLTRFLLEDADIFLLDEPTNNLDIPSLIWLESFLKESKKTLIIVSHDLYFMDAVTNRVFVLTEKTIQAQRGSYTDYLQRQEKEYLRQKEMHERQQKEILRLEEQVSATKEKSEKIDKTEVRDSDKRAAGWSRDRASSSQGRAKALSRRLKKLDRIEKPFEEETFAMRVHSKDIESDVAIVADQVVVGYKDTELPAQHTTEVGPFSFELKIGTRVCFMGENGVGKSTVLRSIIGMHKPLSGTITVSEGVTFGDLMQQHERADRSCTAVELFTRETGTDTEKAFHMLKKYGLPEHALHQTVGKLSSGTRARTLFAIFDTLGVNMLILDEPTNHLDMPAVRALCELLKTYNGAVLLVSHNRWFLEQVHIQQYYEISDGSMNRIKDFEAYLKQVKTKAERIIARLKRSIT